MSGSGPTNAWYLRDGRLNDRWWRTSCYFDDRFPDGHTVDVAEGADPGDLDGVAWLWHSGLDDDGRLAITVDADAAPGAPSLWYVHIDERTPEGEAVILVAFATGHLPDGTVIPNSVFVPMKVRSDQQAGAIRWWRDQAVVDQIFVRKDLRRAHVGSKIIYAASGLHQAHGWPGRLHSDGRRTDIGQRFVAGLRHPDRIAAWEEKMPPMDPTGT